MPLHRHASTDCSPRSSKFLQKQLLRGHLTGHILEYVRQGVYVQMTCPETAPGWLQMSLVWGPLQKGVSAQHLAACFQLPPVPDMHPDLQQSACMIQWMHSCNTDKVVKGLHGYICHKKFETFKNILMKQTCRHVYTVAWHAVSKMPRHQDTVSALQQMCNVWVVLSVVLQGYSWHW